MIPNTYTATYELIKHIIDILGNEDYRQSNKEDFFQIEVFKVSNIYKVFNNINKKELVIEKGITSVELNILIREDMSIIRVVYYRKDDITSDIYISDGFTTKKDDKYLKHFINSGVIKSTQELRDLCNDNKIYTVVLGKQVVFDITFNNTVYTIRHKLHRYAKPNYVDETIHCIDFRKHNIYKLIKKGKLYYEKDK